MSWLRRRIGIEPGEGRLFACATLILFLVGWGSVQITNVSETLFLKRVGVEFLPLVFLVNSALLIGTTGLMGRLAGRTKQVPLLLWTLVGLAVALIPLWLAVLGGGQDWIFTVLLMSAKQLDSIAMLVFWVAIGGLMHGRQAKRLYAPIWAGATLGTILGSFASGPLGRLIGITSLVPVAAASLLVAALFTLPLRRMAAGARLARRLTVAREAPAPTAAGLWRDSLLFRVLVSSAVFSGVLGPMLYFQFSYVADIATQGSDGEQQLLDLYAQFRGWINFAVLGLQLAGTSALYRRIGVPLASALSPLTYLLGFAGLSVRLNLPAGIGAVAVTNFQDHAVYEPAQKVLLTLFAERARGYVTALIDGPIKRAGGALGNLAVLGLLAIGTPIWVGWAALPVAAAWLVAAVLLWRAYPTILLEVVGTRRHDEDELPLGELIDPGTLRVLEASLVEGDPEHCRAACGLLLEAPPDRVAGVLLRALPRAPIGNQAEIVTTLDRLVRDHRRALPVPADGVREVGPLLTDAAGLAPLDRARLVRAYLALAGPVAGDDLLIELAEDPEGAVRLAAAATLQARRGEDIDPLLAAAVTSADADEREIARDELRALLLDAEPDQRWRERLTLLTASLTRPDDRASAARALADLAGRHGAALAEQADALVPLGRDPDTRVREAVLRFVGNARLTDQAGWLVERITARDRHEATAAREALRAIGPLAMDLLLEALHFGKRSTRLALLPILREMAVDGRSLRQLVDAELDCMQRTAVHLHALAEGGVSDLVLQRLQERVTESAHTALLLLATLLDEDRIARLCRLLGRTSRDGRERAVLLEALEALLPPDHRARVMPILEEQDPAVRAAAAARTLGHALPSFERALREVLEGDDALTRDFLDATLDPATRARFGLGSPEGQPYPETPGNGTAVGPGRPSNGHPATTNDAERDEESSVLSKVEVVLHLRSLDIFSRLTTRQLTDLAAVVTEETHPSGTVIVREGAFEDCMYLIVAGQVKITKDEHALADLGPRDFFGEMAVFDGETRSATATATSALRLLRLERHDLFLVMEEQPGIAITICQTLTRRLRNLNQQVQ